MLSLVGCGSAALPAIAIEHNRAGTEHLAAHRLDEAEARFRLALEYRSRFAEPHANLGLVEYLRGHLDEAEAHLRAAIDLNEDFAAAWANLGVVLEQQHRSVDARQAYERALDIDPAQTGARRNLAFLLARDELFIEARAHLMRLVEMDPSDAQADAVLAWCDLRLDRPEHAMERANSILSRNPNEATALLVRGAAAAARGDLDGAYQDLLIAREHSAFAVAATHRLASVELLRGHIVETRAIITQLLRNDDRDVVAHWLGGSIALVERDREAARRHALAVLALRPTMQEPHVILAYVALLDGNVREVHRELDLITEIRFRGHKARILALLQPSRSNAQMW